jgi:hypothetical protein
MKILGQNKREAAGILYAFMQEYMKSISIKGRGKWRSSSKVKILMSQKAKVGYLH